MLRVLLRFIVIVLSFTVIGGIVSYSAFLFKPKIFTFKQAGSFFWIMMIGFAAVGSLTGIYDYITVARIERTIPSSGLVLGGTADFGCYWDVTGTREVTEVEWGTLEPGDNGTISFYVKNEATKRIYCAISWVEESWQPEGASQHFDLTWNFGENSLGVNRARKVVLELHVSPDIMEITDFSFNILISAQDEPWLG